MIPTTPGTHYWAWLTARRARWELEAGRNGMAAALAMSSRVFGVPSPLADEVIGSVRVRIAGELPEIRGRDARRWFEAINPIEGWLTEGEATILARCVAATTTMTTSTTRAVEIGSYKGRSTVLLALTIKELGSRLRLMAIDPHIGYHFGGGANTYELLHETIFKHSVEGVVDVVRARSTDVRLREPLALVFIDGLHDRVSVREDHAHVAPSVILGGLVVFHDYREQFPGVFETVNELLCGGSYELVGWCESIIALRKERLND